MQYDILQILCELVYLEELMMAFIAVSMLVELTLIEILMGQKNMVMLLVKIGQEKH
jgi:hypothetical protein